MEQRRYHIDLHRLNHEANKAVRYSPTKGMLENATLYNVTYVDGEDSPLAVFNFSYCSKGKTDAPILCKYDEIVCLLTLFSTRAIRETAI
jgi:hypothetical protein